MQQDKKLNIDTTSLFQNVSKVIYKSKLEPGTLKKAKVNIRKLAKYLNISEQETIIFTIIYIQNMAGFGVDSRFLTEFLGLELHQFIDIKESVDGLLEKRLVTTEMSIGINKRRSRIAYDEMIVNVDILEAITAGKPINEQLTKSLDVYQFCQRVSDMIEERSERQLDTSTLLYLTEKLENENLQLPAIRALHEMKFSVDARILLYEMVDDLVAMRTGVTSLEATIRDIYDNTRYRVTKIREIIELENELVKTDMISVQSGGFLNDACVSLTEKSLNLIIGEDSKIFTQKAYSRDLLKSNKLTEKALFFDEKLSAEIDFFKNALRNENYISLQQRLQEMNLIKGVTAIFYGSPGTGKTETVYQIAKETGRDIYPVDISQVKSKWFGDSEKRIKSIFSTYKMICKSSDLTPILLFNEADGVLSKRKENQHSPTSQTENAIQNIILDEMETFEGILIATTNLVNNLDKAFERRFIFKIEFNKPNTEIKKLIWQNKLSWLDNEQAELLAAKFTFTGGEIDNVVRKATLNYVLTGQHPNIDNLLEYCENEKFSKMTGRKVGYS